MRIVKKITACDDFAACNPADPKCASIEHIKQAIECLAAVADTDVVAKESIANLAVVLLDLQSE